eukprot:1578466-Rhodomonas_salina.1
MHVHRFKLVHEHDGEQTSNRMCGLPHGLLAGANAPSGSELRRALSSVRPGGTTIRNDEYRPVQDETDGPSFDELECFDRPETMSCEADRCKREVSPVKDPM